MNIHDSCIYFFIITFPLYNICCTCASLLTERLTKSVFYRSNTTVMYNVYDIVYMCEILCDIVQSE